MERDTDDLQSVIFGCLQEGAPLVDRRTKLAAQTALTSAIVCGNAEDELNFFRYLGALGHFGRIVKCDHANALTDGVLEVARCLARVGVNDFGFARQASTDLVDKLDFATRRAVKIRSHERQRLDNDWIGVALDGIKRLDAREALAPLVDCVWFGNVHEKRMCNYSEDEQSKIKKYI